MARIEAALAPLGLSFARLLPTGESILEDLTLRINDVFTGLELDSDDLERVVTTLSAIRST